jgi:inner membrane transporter RhtA
VPAADELPSASAPAPGGLPGTDRVPPLALLLTGITSTQFGAALAATLFDDLGAAGASLLRLLFAAAILMVLVRPRIRRRDPAALRLVFLFGLALGVMNLTFYEALARVPLGVAVTIEFVGPLAVAVFTSRRRADLLWAAIAAVAIVLLADPSGGSVDAFGLLLALIAGACWGLYIILAQRTGQVFAGADAVALAMVVAALFPIIPGLLQGGSHLVHPQYLLLGCAVALLSSVIPYSLETDALRRLPTNVFGVLMSLEPAVAALAGLVVLGQGLRTIDVVAIALVVVASAGVSRRRPPTAEA